MVKLLMKIEDVFDRIMLILLIILGTWVLYCAWDSWQIYNKANSSTLIGWKPEEPEGSGSPSFKDLLAVNPDVVGWITVDGTKIDYPVVQASDNEKYLNRDVYGNFSLAGTPFLDSRNSSDFSDFYNIIYGHHMDRPAMFSELTEFTEQDVLDAKTTGTLMTPKKVYAISWFACLETKGNDPVAYGIFSDEKDAAALMKYLSKNASSRRKVKRGQILALSTCVSAGSDDRVILYGTFREKKR